ncbi:hypothetical protein PGT21_008416 [Puccinia graminis f. sp. tritici]|uniref:Glycogen [starch] synthase n=1 Tax=Puccinia graminis f. sp. tritici TaxID=56615 RepID=A0A5B0MLE6_PUCGR|nr:hypothetical protein PGT21_008416 [Puccinia graminis f. sp. tritici]
MEVEAIEPDMPEMRDSLQSMKERGGGPRVLLFDTGSMMSWLDEWKNELWNLAGNNTIVFGYLVVWF